MRHKRGAETNALAGVGSDDKSQETQTDFGTLATGSSFESWIQQLGQNLIAAYQGGDRETACRFQSAMFMAIRARHPAKQHRRFMEIDAAIWGAR
jgi:hypothetical protein